MSDTEIILNEIATVNDAGVIVARIGGFREQEAQLALMEAEAKGGLVFDCSDAKQDKAAREWRRKCVTMRTGLAELRLSITRPVDTVKRMIIDAQKSIETRCITIEEMADAPIKAHEKNVAAIAAEKARIEAERKAKHQSRIDVLLSTLNSVNQLSSEEIRARLAEAEKFPVDDSFEEYLPKAFEAKRDVLYQLTESLAATIAREDRERVAAETAHELELLRAQQVEEARQRFETEKAARIESDRIAAENAEQLRIAIARITEHEEALRKQAEQIAAAKVPAIQTKPAANLPTELRLCDLAPTDPNIIYSPFQWELTETPLVTTQCARSITLLETVEALGDIIEICKSRDILINKKLELILQTAYTAIGEPIA